MSIKLRSKRLKDGRRSLYLDAYVSGQRSFSFLNLYLGSDKSANKTVLELAKKVRLQKEVELASGRLGVSITPSNVEFKSFMDQSISNKLLGTQQQYQQMYLHLEDFGGKGITLQSITPVFADDFKSYLLSRIKPSTASIYFGLLKAVMAMAIRKEIILKNPCAGISIKVPESLPKYLTIEEVHRLVVTDCSNVEVKNAFLFSVMTGLRLSDIIRLQWSMIESNRIVIQQKKTGRVVVIPLSGYALGVLDQLQHNTPFVFHLPPYGTLKYILRNWVKAAGITKRVTFHCARHTFGTLLLNSGVDIYVLSQLMGHVSISMTTRYAKLLSPRKVEAIALFPDINKNLAL